MRTPLAIYRLKDSHVDRLYSAPNEALNKDARKSGAHQRLSVDSQPDSPYAVTLFSVPKKPRAPKWVQFLAALDPRAESMFAKSRPNAAVLIAVRKTPPQPAAYAITFGSGRFALDDSLLVRGFGLRTALSIIDPERLQNIGHVRIDFKTVLTNQQSVVRTAFHDFDFDTESEMLGGVKGGVLKSVPSVWAGNVAGRDPLYLDPELTPATLSGFLDWVTSTYAGKAYRTNYEWLDHVRHVSDGTLRDKLIGLCVAHLAGGTTSKRAKRRGKKGAPKGTAKVELGLPESLPNNELARFSFGASGPVTAPSTDLTIEDYVTFLKSRSLSRKRLENDQVHVLRSDDTLIAKWKVLKCLSGTVTTGGKHYVVHAGDFYAFEPKFERRIDQKLMGFSKTTGAPCPPWTAALADEAAYNKLLSTALPGSLLLDAKCLTTYRGRSKIELCDVIDPASGGATMYFVKKYRGSAPISHLAAQAHVSCAALVGDSDFRDDIGKRWPVLKPLVTTPPARGTWTARICIGTKKSARKLDKLPFFAKLTLSNRATHLSGLGFRVEVETFPVN